MYVPRLHRRLGRLVLVLTLPHVSVASADDSRLREENLDHTKVAINGFMYGQYYIDTNANANVHHLNRVMGPDDGGVRHGFAFDATRVNVQGERTLGSVSPWGRFEFDLQDSDYFRIRHAVAGLSSQYVGFQIGQTDSLIGNLSGPYLFNNDWYWALGNAYDRLPQVRISSDTGGFHFALAATQNPISAGPGTPPQVQFRANYRFCGGDTIGLSGLVGTAEVTIEEEAGGEESREKDLDSWAIATDVVIPIARGMGSSLQAWYSSSAAHGTGNQEFAGLYWLDQRGRPRPMNAAGGFVEFHASVQSFSIAVAAGLNRSLDPGDVRASSPVLDYNVTSGINLSYDFADNFVAGVEVQWVRTKALGATTPVVAADGTEALASGYTSENVRTLIGAKYTFDLRSDYVERP